MHHFQQPLLQFRLNAIGKMNPRLDRTDTKPPLVSLRLVEPPRLVPNVGEQVLTPSNVKSGQNATSLVAGLSSAALERSFGVAMLAIGLKMPLVKWAVRWAWYRT